MAYGPLGEAVSAIEPDTEADPIGTFASGLSLWSGTINGRVTMAHGRPLVVWTSLVGDTGDGGKGTAYDAARALLAPAIGQFLQARIVGGVSSGPSLVHTLADYEAETKGTETGLDARIVMVYEEWADALKRQKRCPTFSTVLRTCWDGKAIQNKTIREHVQVDRPCVGFHAHITPGEWARYLSASDAAGGSFNRILPVRVELSKILPHGHVTEYPDIPALESAYQWAMRKPRTITLSHEAARMYDRIRAEVIGRLKEMPAGIKHYLARAPEQTARVACALTAAEKSTSVNLAAMEAAWAFVQYSMRSVESLVRETESGKPKPRQERTMEDRIRDFLAARGGSSPRSPVLRSVCISADELTAVVDGMLDVELVKQPSTGGRPAIMVRVVESTDDGEDEPDSTTTVTSEDSKESSDDMLSDMLSLV